MAATVASSVNVGLSRDMGHTSHILLVEDDREIGEFVSRFLLANDMRVTTIGCGRDIDRVLSQKSIDLVVLDIALPGEDGLSICARLRATMPNLPIIMLTAKSEDTDRIAGLEIGADDYLTKPFNPRELLARIRAVLRRGGIGAAEDSSLETLLNFDGWRFDLNTRHLHNQEGARIILTGAEFNLLRVFCERPMIALSRDQLLDLTQGRTANLYERTIDILVSRLRQKIEPNPKEPVLIQTIRSVGYQFSTKVTYAQVLDHAVR